MDINELHTMMLDMAVTERRLPKAIRVQKQASWPDYPMDWHGYGWTQIGEVRLRPTNEQIDAMDRGATAQATSLHSRMSSRVLVLYSTSTEYSITCT